MMKGFDQGWTYVDSNRRFATYTNLNPGEYTFMVKGSNNDGIWNEQGASVKIIINPPWWKTIWFKAFMFVLFLFIIYCVVIYVLKLRSEIRQLAPSETGVPMQIYAFSKDIVWAN